ncbi:hypothetical protein AC788_12220 [Pseudomonas sp. RIT-PI-a]|nr:hypothetical protein AC788_12220 [Pseudomonas sp. RIT-PI-a]
MNRWKLSILATRVIEFYLLIAKSYDIGRFIRQFCVGDAKRQTLLQRIGTDDTIDGFINRRCRKFDAATLNVFQ